MLCKIGGSAQPVQQIVWRNFDTGITSPHDSSGGAENLPAGTALTHAAPFRAAGNQPLGSSPALEQRALEQRTLESDRARALELARVRKEGVEDGRRQGTEAAAREVQTAMEQVARTLQELVQQRNKLRVEAEREVVKLSLAIARRILYREISTDPEAIAGIVNAALQKLQKRSITRVKVYPAGVAVVRAALERGGNSPMIEVVPDPSLAAGGLLLETAQGDLDASVESQLQEIQRGFADRLSNR